MDLGTPSLGHQEDAVSKRSRPNELIKQIEAQQSISPELQPVDDLQISASPRYQARESKLKRAKDFDANNA